MDLVTTAIPIAAFIIALASFINGSRASQATITRGYTIMLEIRLADIEKRLKECEQARKQLTDEKFDLMTRLLHRSEGGPS